MKTTENLKKIVYYAVKTVSIVCIIFVATIFVASSIIEFMEDGFNGKTFVTAVIAAAAVGLSVAAIIFILKKQSLFDDRK